MFLKVTSIAKLKNKYIVRSRISEKKFRKILKYFAENIEASKISNLTKISEATLCKIFREIRIIMSKEREKISKFLGEIEIDESYFGSKRVRGERGRGAANKTLVFGMLKCDGKVYTQIVKNCSASELYYLSIASLIALLSILIAGRLMTDWLIMGPKSTTEQSILRMSFSYAVLATSQEAVGKNHINGIENF